MGEPELMDLVLSSEFESLKFKQNTNSEKYNIIGTAIELKGMLKMIEIQLSTVNYSDEYLNLVRDFLCHKVDAKKILLCQKLSLIDRIPFLIRFAPEQLLEVLDECIKEACDQGYLEFIILIQEEHQIIQLIQSYLDRTGDIQTTAIVGLKLLSIKLITKEELVARVITWYKFYQSFLNKNQLYIKRAKVDEKKIEIVKNVLGVNKEEQTRHAEVNLTCYHCKNPSSLSQWVSLLLRAQVQETRKRPRGSQRCLEQTNETVHLHLSFLSKEHTLL